MPCILPKNGHSTGSRNRICSDPLSQYDKLLKKLNDSSGLCIQWHSPDSQSVVDARSVARLCDRLRGGLRPALT